MPKDPRIKKVLVIGSGPIIIGQAAEFDYSGTQGFARTSAPAPWPRISGMVPAIKAMEVITIGRRRRRRAYPSSAASMMPFPGSPARGQTRRDQNGVFTGQTHQDHQPHLHEDVVIAPTVSQTQTARSIVIGTIRITASGRVQLSYSAASTRNASSTATGKTISACVLPCKGDLLGS